MTNLPARDSGQAENYELAIVQGDLSKLSPQDRLAYYGRLCETLELNPLSKPFEYITLNGKLVLYARKDATDQLRAKRGVSLQIVARERLEDVYVVTARATTKDGRTDESIGAVPLGTLKGEGLANALMKAETKAKRRVTLSICGLGMLDESEVGSVPGAYPTPDETPAAPLAFAPDTGEVIEAEAEDQTAAARRQYFKEERDSGLAALIEEVDAGSGYAKALARSVFCDLAGREMASRSEATADDLKTARKSLQQLKPDARRALVQGHYDVLTAPAIPGMSAEHDAALKAQSPSYAARSAGL